MKEVSTRKFKRDSGMNGAYLSGEKDGKWVDVRGIEGSCW